MYASIDHVTGVKNHSAGTFTWCLKLCVAGYLEEGTRDELGYSSTGKLWTPKIQSERVLSEKGWSVFHVIKRIQSMMGMHGKVDDQTENRETIINKLKENLKEKTD